MLLSSTTTYSPEVSIEHECYKLQLFVRLLNSKVLVNL